MEAAPEGRKLLGEFFSSGVNLLASGPANPARTRPTARTAHFERRPVAAFTAPSRAPLRTVTNLIPAPRSGAYLRLPSMDHPAQARSAPGPPGADRILYSLTLSSTLCRYPDNV